MGFITTKSDAVLLRIESATTQDYMELEIVEGNIFMCYNVGTSDLPLGEIGTKVNDNTYHVVRFSRKGGNATLQLDDYNVQTLTPQGMLEHSRHSKLAKSVIDFFKTVYSNVDLACLDCM